MEEELGYPLIVRSQGKRTVSLTEQGKIFAGYAEQMLPLFEHVCAIANENKQYTINFASPAILDSNRIACVIQNYRSLFPENNIVLHTRHSYDATSGVTNGSLDLAIVTRLTHISKIKYIPISNEPYQLVTHWNFCPDVKCFSPKDLNPSKEIRMPWDLAYESWHTYWFGEDTLPYIKVDRLSLVSLFLKETHGWVLVPVSIAMKLCEDSIFIKRQLSDLPSNICLYLIQKKHNSNADLLTNFASCFN